MLGSSPARAGPWAAALAPVGVALATFWIAYDDGSYDLDGRNAIAIGVWWSIVMLVALGLAPIQRLRGPALVVAGLLFALALVTLASLAWSPSSENTLHEVNRVTLYLGVFVLVVLLAARDRAASWADGLALAVAAIGTVALASRCFPSLFGDRGLAQLLPSAATRLSFPLGYWNGLGIFLGLGVPLLLRLAVAGQSRIARGAALAPFPVLGAAMYLTSSRGGVATALMGTLVFFALTERRWEAGLAITVGAAGVVAAVAVLLAHDELVDGPLGSTTVASQGRNAAGLIACLAVATALGFLAGLALLTHLRPPRLAGVAIVAISAIAVLAAGIAADPVGRFRQFRASPDQHALPTGASFVREHLLSGGGSGRWQFWASAVDQWRAAPLHGGGAGTYEAWWAAHAPFSQFIRDAHSLYLEQLGELGPLGPLLALGAIALSFVVGQSRTRRLEGPERVTAASLSAVVAGFAVAAGIDWIWELTAVTVVAVVAMGLVSGSATGPEGGLDTAASATGPEGRLDTAASATRSGRRVSSIGITLLAIAVVSAQAVPLLADHQLARSRDAAARNEGRAALVAAANGAGPRAMGRNASPATCPGRGAARPIARRQGVHRPGHPAGRQRLAAVARRCSSRHETGTGGACEPCAPARSRAQPTLASLSRPPRACRLASG